MLRLVSFLSISERQFIRGGNTARKCAIFALFKFAWPHFGKRGPGGRDQEAAALSSLPTDGSPPISCSSNQPVRRQLHLIASSASRKQTASEDPRRFAPPGGLLLFAVTQVQRPSLSASSFY